MTFLAQSFLCNGGELKPVKKKKGDDTNKVKRLSFYSNREEIEQNITISLMQLRSRLTYIPARILDLLEIAAYVFCADRLSFRGASDNVHFDKWTRDLKFIIKVRDYDFWSGPVSRNLSDLLEFVTGDRSITFEFQPGHQDITPHSLFDSTEFAFPSGQDTSIALFSGGLDSLAGTIDLLETTQNKLCLVSHDSGNHGTQKTINGLVQALGDRYGKRVSHYPFVCKLKSEHNKAIDETQRSRIFLYSTIAFTLASINGLNSFYIFENGITSLNFPKRQDMNRARASRTTHPKTIHLLKSFFSAVSESDFVIKTPFSQKLKSDIVKTILGSPYSELISSSVSCAHTRDTKRDTPQCGVCNQCVDRRIAAFAANAQDLDHSGLYGVDFLKEGVNAEGQTIIIDYFNFMNQFATMSLETFGEKFMNELTYILELVSPLEQSTYADQLHKLFQRHAKMVSDAYYNMLKTVDRINSECVKDSIFDLIEHDKHLKSGIVLIADTITEKLSRLIPIVFASNKPKNERALNDYIHSVLVDNNYFGLSYDREASTNKFMLSLPIADHALGCRDIFIEAKLINPQSVPSKFTEQIAADVTKYRENPTTYLLFIVYDVGGKIPDPGQWIVDLERYGPDIKVCVIK